MSQIADPSPYSDAYHAIGFVPYQGREPLICRHCSLDVKLFKGVFIHFDPRGYNAVECWPGQAGKEGFRAEPVLRPDPHTASIQIREGLQALAAEIETACRTAEAQGGPAAAIDLALAMLQALAVHKDGPERLVITLTLPAPRDPQAAEVPS